MSIDFAEIADPYDATNAYDCVEVANVCCDAGEKDLDDEHASPAGGAFYDYQNLGRWCHSEGLWKVSIFIVAFIFVSIFPVFIISIVRQIIIVFAVAMVAMVIVIWLYRRWKRVRSAVWK